MHKERRFKRHVLTAISSIKELLDNNESNGQTASDMAVTFGVSRNVLQEGFKQLYGMGIRDYKLKQRMELARKMMEEGFDLKIVSFTLHYSSQAAFSSAFKNYYGIAPTAWILRLGPSPNNKPRKI